MFVSNVTFRSARICFNASSADSVVVVVVVIVPFPFRSCRRAVVREQNKALWCDEVVQPTRQARGQGSINGLISVEDVNDESKIGRASAKRQTLSGE